MATLALTAGSSLIEQRLVSLARGGYFTLAGDSATGDRAGSYSPSESVERSVNSVSRDAAECVEVRRLLLLACGAHAEGGAAGRVAKSVDARSREAEEGPATSAS